jgi:hypothetical protein
MKKHFILILMVLINFCCIAQNNDTIYKALNVLKYDTSRIVDLSNKLAFYINISGKIYNIDIQSKTSEKQLQLVPNGKTYFGFGLDYKWIGLGFSFSGLSTEEDEQKYGKTERYDIQINYYRNSFGVDAYLKYYKGFYLENPQDFIDWPFKNYPLLKGMETFSTGISGYYVFNHYKFSYKAAFPRTMWQKKSAGSFILGAYLSRNLCNAPDGVLPAELPDSLKNKYDIKGFSNTIAGISFGYTYTWVIKKRFFINLSVVPGLGIAFPEVLTSLENKKYKPSLSYSVTSRASLGYEAKHFYYGFNLVNIIDNFDFENIQVSTSTGNIRIFIGRRFDISKLFKHKH